MKAKLPTIWTDGKAQQPGRNSDAENVRGEKRRDGEVRGEKMQVREKVGKSRNIVFSRRFVAPEGREVGSLKPHAVVARSTF